MIDQKTPTTFRIAFLMFHNLDMKEAIKFTNISILRKFEVVSYVYLDPKTKYIITKRSLFCMLFTQREFIITSNLRIPIKFYFPSRYKELCTTLVG